MYYKESQSILDEIKKANRIMMMCHEGPDMDSVLSCLVLKYVLNKLGKESDIYSKDRLNVMADLLDSAKDIIIANPGKIDLSKYDLFFALDVNDLRRLGLKEKINLRGKIINIDHHANQGFGDVNINDINSGSTTSLLYYLFLDWGIELEKEILNKVLVGLINDTGVFHYSVYDKPIIFKTVADLIDRGADYEESMYTADQNYDLMVFKYWAEAINRIKVDKKNKFAYVAMPYEINKKYIKYGVRSRWLADEILRKIKGTNFGMSILEDGEGHTNISIRTRTPGYYVIDLLKQLNGGGHLTGGGAAVKGIPFDKAVMKVLQVARKYAKSNN